MVFDSKEDTLSPYMEIFYGENNADAYSGFAYHQKEKAIYYSGGGKIYKQSPEKGQEHVGYTDIKEAYYQDKGSINQQGIYTTFAVPEGLQIRNVYSDQKMEKPVTIYGYTSQEADRNFRIKYPNVPLVKAQEGGNEYYNSQGIAQAIQTGEKEVDVFIIEGSEVYNLMKKEYALPLSSNKVIKEQVGRMYPFIQEGIMFNGEIYAVPMEIQLTTTTSCSARILEEVGLAEEGIPTTYEEYLNLYQKWKEEEIEEKFPDLGFFDYPVRKDYFIYGITRDYANYYHKLGEIINFDTPLYRELMGKMEEVFKDEKLYTPSGEEEGNYKEGLFVEYGDNILEAGEYQPVTISLGENMEPVMEAWFQMAIINPASENKEMAMAYLQEIITSYSREEQVLCFTDEKMPIENEEFDKWVKDWEGFIAENKEKLKTAQGPEKKEIERIIERGERFLEDRESHKWKVSEEMIKRYEEIAPKFFIPKGEVMDIGDEENNIYRLLDEYEKGAMTLNQFISEANRRMEMIALEGQ